MDTTVDHFTPLALRVRGNKTREWFLLQGEGAPLTQKCEKLHFNNNELILIGSTQAAGIESRTRFGEGEGGELEATSTATYFYCYVYLYG